MKVISTSAWLLLAALLILSGCGQQENQIVVHSYSEQEGWVADQGNSKWYMQPEYQPRREPVLNEHEKWVIRCLKDFEFIQPGVTRQEVMRKFPMDGGLQGVSPVRFVHPECSWFKIDVFFIFERNSDGQGRAIMGKDDKVTDVSKPYIENPFYD